MGRILSLVMAAALASSVNAATFSHSGRAVDYHTGQPVSVRGTAYIRVLPSGDDCPTFAKDSFLVEAQTENDKPGLFRFFLDPEKQKSYGAVFCANNYYARIEPGQQNTLDGSPVIPYPMAMFAKKDRALLGDDVREVLDQFESELRYLRSIDREKFEAAVKEWSKARDWNQFGEVLLTYFNQRWQ